MTSLANPIDPPALPCPACGGRFARPYRRVRDVRLIRCTRCSLTYTDPQHEDRVLDRYLGEYDLAQHFGELSARKRVLYEQRLAELPRPAPEWSRLCDVGCGDGQFLELAAQRGWQPHGIELNPPAAERARQRGATIALGRLEKLDGLAWGRFDAVTSWDCLEHVPATRRFAERLVALVRPGGVIALTTLNLRSLVYRVFGAEWSMIHEDHFTYWDHSSLRHLFEQLGCVVEDISSFGLGRDFVRWIDLLAGLRRHVGPSIPQQNTARTLHSCDWDVSAPVLALERLANRGLDAAGAGVGLYARILRPLEAGVPLPKPR